MGTVTETVHTARLGLEFVFLMFFWLHDLSVFFHLGQLFPFMFLRWCNKLK